MFYNDVVTRFNRFVCIFPSNIMAFIFKFLLKEYFQIMNLKQEMPSWGEMSMKGNKLCIIYLSILFVFVSGLLALPNVHAKGNELEKEHIHAYVHEDGSATITEERKVHISEGTEMFIVIGNLRKSEIKDFTVEENGETFTYVDDWDIDASLEDKRKKNGIIKNGSEYELVWGVGDYADHTYTVEYTITDFVKQLEDDQMIFWRFVNDKTNVPPKNVTVEIETDKGFDIDSEKIWVLVLKETFIF